MKTSIKNLSLQRVNNQRNSILKGYHKYRNKS